MLIMVGEGKLRPEMERYIASKELNNIILTGFVNQSEIAKYYSIADLFVMCSGSGETWGLSVNEAMCFSLPVIVSETTGCSVDLVENGINGFTFEEGNIPALAKAIKRILDNKELREDFGRTSQIIIRNYSNQHIVNNLKEAFA
jgi:glycosyltransferase involved in cell wall biosynthesis